MGIFFFRTSIIYVATDKSSYVNSYSEGPIIEGRILHKSMVHFKLVSSEWYITLYSFASSNALLVLYN